MACDSGKDQRQGKNHDRQTRKGNITSWPIFINKKRGGGQVETGPKLHYDFYKIRP